MRAASAFLGVAVLACSFAAAAQDGRVAGRTPDRGSVLSAPGAVRPYAIIERRASIIVERRIPVGDVLPQSVDAYHLPDSDDGYVVLDGRRYIIDDQRRVVEALD